MNYDPEKTNENLQGVPMKNRVFIYNAEIIIEFLNKTFMPTPYFLNMNGLNELMPGVDIEPKHLKDPKVLEEERFTIGDLYEFYKLYRQQVDYTTPIESRYKFSVILKKLSLRRNGWKFRFRRYTRAQLVYVAPAQLRARVPLEIRQAFPPGGCDVSAGQVEVPLEDMMTNEPVSESEATYKLKEEGDDNFTEVVTDYDAKKRSKNRSFLCRTIRETDIKIQFECSVSSLRTVAGLAS